MRETLYPGDALATQGFIGDVFRIVGYEDWMSMGACRNAPDADAWFPDATKPAEDVRAAKSICNETCPVREACLAFAIEKHEQTGIWGGKDFSERQEFNRQESLKERRPIDRGRCGTLANHRQHLRRGEKPCEACRRANVRKPRPRGGR